MANFNTNQARQLYVASARKTSAAGVTSNGDIALLTDQAGDFYFVYKNGDGIVTRSDVIPAGCIEYVNKRTAAQCARPLMAYTVAVDNDAIALTDLVGKTVRIKISCNQFMSYSDNDSVPVIAEFAANSTNTATAAAFHKELAMAIAKALPKKDIPYFKVYSSGTEVTADTAAGSVTGSANGVVLVPGQQKWVRGKMTGEPLTLDIATSVKIANTDDIAWGKSSVATVADTNTAQSTSISPVSISGSYELADLEYFALGERGDIYRGSFWPNDVTPTYMVNVASTYDVLSVQYYWQGHAENIQKSPRTIQVAGPTAVINALYTALTGAGSGAGA